MLKNSVKSVSFAPKSNYIFLSGDREGILALSDIRQPNSFLLSDPKNPSNSNSINNCLFYKGFEI